MNAVMNAEMRGFGGRIDDQLIQILLLHQNHGDKIFFARRHNGQIKVKIKYGPAKLREKRFVTNNETFEEIKKVMKLS